MTFKAVLFDIDGTLLDSLEDLADSTNYVLKQSGFPEHDTSKYKYFVGDGFDKLIQRVLPESSRDTGTIAGAVAKLEKEYSRRWAEKTSPYDGIPALLDRIVDRGFKMVALSNKPDGPAKRVISHFFDKWHFDIVFGSRPVIPNKPDPTAALEISETLNILPEDFLYLGDTGIDMKTAVAANMYPLGVLWGFRKADELIESGARMLIAHPEDLLPWL